MNDCTTPKRCTKCGVEYPATTEYFAPAKRYQNGLNSRCRECLRSEARARYTPEKGHAKYAKKSPEVTRSYSAKWRKNNPEKAKEVVRKSRLKHLDKHRAGQRAWFERNPEYQKQRYADNPQLRTYYRIARRKRRAVERSLPTDFTVNDWNACLAYFEHKCAVCDTAFSEGVQSHADHWIALTLPDCPGTVKHNMVCLCQKCNQRKKNKPYMNWLIEWFGVDRAKQIAERIQSYFEWIKQQ